MRTLTLFSLLVLSWTLSAEAGPKEKLQQLASTFAATSPEINLQNLSEMAVWNCSFSDIVYKKGSVKTKTLFEPLPPPNAGVISWHPTDIEATNPLHASFFSLQNRQWQFGNAASLMTLRMPGPKTVIVEYSGDPSMLAGAYVQVSCTSEKDCFFKDSDASYKYIVTGYNYCTR